MKDSRIHRSAGSLVRCALAVVLFSSVAPVPAEAGFWCWLVGSGCGGGNVSGERSSERSAPEIDPGALANAIALVAGGAALLGDRVRRRR